ncbi:helix-turn-helix transcriptional regulator [Microbacterium sp. SORGH_AS_0888]|uniref:helix-turn-helix domain-containing protein n=1 Tax=Microbacterium sp. SORGH_AS_0888 TaxID=3041791 RepID=UPI0027D8587F|nr:helix-turn-helix transcriptional regulator [Microbacterium sp. SORGH_AS_0888]
MSERDDEANFARNMAVLRERRGMSQSELARRMTERGFDNYSQMTVSRTEKGQRPIRLGEARVLAEVLGSRLEEMTRGSGIEEMVRQLTSVADGLAQAMTDTVHSLSTYGSGVEVARELEARPTADDPAVAESLENMRVYCYPVEAVARWAAEVATDPQRDPYPTEVTLSDLDRIAELAGTTQPKRYWFTLDGLANGEADAE